MAQETKKPEVDRGLEEIRREVIEARNLVIKTDNQLKSLHAELKAVSKRQEDFEKRTWMASAVAYALFALIAVGAAWLVSNTRTATALAERKQFAEETERLRGELATLKNVQRDSERLSVQAVEVYRQLGESKGELRMKALDAFRALEKTNLAELEKIALRDRASAVSQEIGQSLLERGKAEFRRAEYTNAVVDLERFLSLNPNETDALDARFFLGSSYAQLKKYQDAVVHLSKFITGDRKSKVRDYAMLLLSQAYEQTQQFEKSAEVARDAINAYPNSEFFNAFKSRLTVSKKNLESKGQVSSEPKKDITAPKPTVDGDKTLGKEKDVLLKTPAADAGGM